MLRNSVGLIILCCFGSSFFCTNATTQCETPLLKNGIVVVSFSRKFASFKCNPSFKTYGAYYSWCENGKFEVPFCIKSGCPPLQTTTNASTITLYNNNATASLFCKSGYIIGGSSVALCDGVNWDRILGTCRKDSNDSLTWCNFEPNKKCGWKILATNDIYWERRNGYTQQTQHLRIGPKQDHTSQHPLDGHYAITHSAYQSAGKPRLLSSVYSSNLSNQTCIRLYYYKFGDLKDVLSVFIKPISISIDSIFDNEKYLLVKILSYRTDDWTKLLFDIKQCSEEFQIIIEASLRSATTNGIAIDDFEILPRDECTADRHQTTVVVPRENKLSGVIYDVQSCKNRCHETQDKHGFTPIGDEIITEGSGRGGIFEHCDCFVECESNESCCPDYLDTCILSTTEADTTPETIDTIVEIDPFVESVEEWATTEEQYTESIELLTKRYPVRFQNKSTTMPKRFTTISTTRRYPARSKTIQTYSPRNITKPISNTAGAVQIIDISNNDKIKTANTTSFITIFVAVGLILVSTFIVLILYKRYRTNARNQLSDVHVLMANEEVKFTPAD